MRGSLKLHAVFVVTSVTLMVNVYQYKLISPSTPHIAAHHGLPVLQLERHMTSRRRAMRDGYRSFMLFTLLKENCPDKRILKDRICGGGLFKDNEEYRTEMKFLLRHIAALAALGFITQDEARIPTDDVKHRLSDDESHQPFRHHHLSSDDLFTQSNNGTDVQFDDALTPAPEQQFDVNTFASTVPFNPSVFCDNTTFSWLSASRAVHPALCGRLAELAEDIRAGRRPPLLTLATWWPDPLYDTEKLTRRNALTSLARLRPLVTPVVVTESRYNMALANSMDWPCLLVPRINAEGSPIFKYMTEQVQSKFKSSFYGYVKASTLFDASLIETLLEVLNSSTRNSGKKIMSDKTKIKQQYQQMIKNTEENQEKDIPIFMTGQSFHVTRSFGVDGHFYETLRKMSHQKRLLKSGDHLCYVIFSATVYFNDAPNYVLVDGDDDDLIYLLKQFALSRNIVVLNTTNTILSVHHSRESVLSEWGKHYLTPVSKDHKYNKRLANRLHNLKQNADNHIISTNYTFTRNTNQISFHAI